MNADASKEMVNPQAVEAYKMRAQEGTDRCLNPDCNADWPSLEWADPKIDQDSYCKVVIDVECRECKTEWREYYDLSALSLLDGEPLDDLE
jgi:hypothetical protein